MESMWKKLQQENKGFSIVELIIAVAILAIISGATLMFMRQSSVTYNNSNADVDVQTEAQLTANAITDRVIDCETQLRFYDGHETTTVDGAGNVITTSDSYTLYYKAEGVNRTVTDHVLLIINATSQTRAVIFWDKNNSAIYYNEAFWNGTGSVWGDFDPEKAEMIAGNVTNFEVKTDKLDTNKVLEFVIEYTYQGSSYEGSYQVHMRNDVVQGDDATPTDPPGTVISKVTVEPKTAFLIARTNQPLELPGTFRARVSGSGAITSVTWDVSETTDQTGVEPEPTIVSQSAFGFKQHGITPIPEPAVKSFRLTATSTQDTSKSGYATIYVKKATAVNVEPTSDLKNDDEGKPVSAKNTTINFTGAADGWNLTRSETAVTWKLYKSLKDSSGNYGAWTEATNTAEAYMSGSTVVLKDNVNASYRFKVEATSIFDPYIKGEYIFYITENVLDVDLKFLRGVNMDLKSYYLANPMEIQGDVTSVLSIDNIKITNVPDYPGDYSRFIYFDSNFVLYVDYDAYHDGDISRKNRFYQELELELQVDFTTPTGTESRTTRITLPAVQVLRVSPADSDIVISKGTTLDLTVFTTGYNISKESLMSVYLDGTKVSGGNSSLNNYLSCRMVTSENGSSILGTRENGVTQGKFRLAAQDNINSYPTAAIPLMIAVDDYYVVSSAAANSYVKYNVYVANVEGATLYVPGPGYSGFPSFSGSTSYRNLTMAVPKSTAAPTGSLSVGMKKVNGRYYMKYNNIEYVYDTSYHYWKKNR